MIINARKYKLLFRIHVKIETPQLVPNVNRLQLLFYDFPKLIFKKMHGQSTMHPPESHGAAS